jgi:hypothetical protein
MRQPLLALHGKQAGNTFFRTVPGQAGWLAGMKWSIVKASSSSPQYTHQDDTYPSENILSSPGIPDRICYSVWFA